MPSLISSLEVGNSRIRSVSLASVQGSRPATAIAIFIEIVLVFLIFMPRRLRAAAASCILLFQLAIMLTGNYGFFNLLTMALCVFLFDDAAMRHLLNRRVASWVKVHAPQPGRAATIAAIVLALVALPVGLDRIWRVFEGSNLSVVSMMTEAVSPMMIVNSYGPFATITMTRPEIVVEGTDDGKTWQDFVFRYKPGPVDRRPSWNIPHQPRLDWQMWFAAYASFSEQPWFETFMKRLLEGSSPVLALLALTPFARHPPKFVRAVLFDYTFASASLHAQTGQWWTRRMSGLYFPQTRLADFTR